MLTKNEIAADWYDRVYLPALEAFRREGLEPNGTDADLFLCVYARRRELVPDRGCTGLDEAAREVLAGDQKRRREGLRRLLPSRA